MNATTPHILVREADGDDLDAVVAVGHASVPQAYADLGDDVVALYLAKWWTADANVPAILDGRTLVAEVDGRVVAMTSYGQHEGRLVIWKLYVMPEHQRHGLGGRLLGAVLDRVRDRHDAVWLSFSEGNAGARRWAHAYGFVEDHREAQVGLPDLLWTRRDIVPGADLRKEVGP